MKSILLRVCLSLLIPACGIVCTFDTALAQYSSYKPGDRVEVMFSGRWQPGTVMPLAKDDLNRGLDKNHWTTRVKGIGSGYWRVVGDLEELIDKAKEISQRTLFGIGFARILNKI